LALIKSDPADAVAYLNRGSALASAAEVALAISDFGVAINLKPDLVEAWYAAAPPSPTCGGSKASSPTSPRRSGLKPDFALAYAIVAWRISRSAITTKPWSTIQSRSTAIPSSLIAISIAAACTSLGRLPEGDQRSRRGPGPETRRSHRPDQARTSLEALGQKALALDDFRAALDADAALESAKEGFARIMTEQQRSEGQK